MNPSPILVVHYNEIWLKGCNRRFFVGRLHDAVERTLEGLPVRRERHVDSRLVVRAQSGEAAAQAAERLRRTPGIQYVGVGWSCSADLPAIIEAGLRLMGDGGFETFRVRARRSVKSHPFSSVEIEHELGGRIRLAVAAAGRPARVDLKNAEASCYVEVTRDEAFVYRDRIPGIGGLPTNTAGRLMCLLSGGIDSAVAAYKMLRRGVRVPFVHFYGQPARPGEDSPPIARRIVRQLTPYQGLSRLFLVPFDPIQREVVAYAPESFRLLIYRRLMLRIAERLARANRCHGTITGDSVAQVASQTLLNIEAVSAPATLPIYRPLCGDDKQQIVDIAREIGTFEISSEPFTDCCPLYLPRNPRIFSRIDELDRAESTLDVERLVDEALYAVRQETYEYRRGTVHLKSTKVRARVEPALDGARAR